jgi:hypothetical protein
VIGTPGLVVHDCVETIAPIHIAQVILITFNVTLLRRGIKRVILGPDPQPQRPDPFH